MLAGTPWRPHSEAPPEHRAIGTRGALLALACVAAGLLVVSAGLPMLADRKASDAQAVSANAGAGELEDAAAEADLAARLDPTASARCSPPRRSRRAAAGCSRRASICSTPSTASPTASSPGSGCSSSR